MLYDGAYMYVTITKESAKITMIKAEGDEIMYTTEFPPRSK